MNGVTPPVPSVVTANRTTRERGALQHGPEPRNPERSRAAGSRRQVLGGEHPADREQHERRDEG